MVAVSLKKKKREDKDNQDSRSEEIETGRSNIEKGEGRVRLEGPVEKGWARG